jgi:hypothetical protein
VRESRTLRLTWRGLETWPWWNCEPIPQSKERDWKPSTYSRRACPRPYLEQRWARRLAQRLWRNVFFLGYEVVPVECIAATTPQAQATSLYDIDTHYGTVAYLGQVLSLLPTH